MRNDHIFMKSMLQCSVVRIPRYDNSLVAIRKQLTPCTRPHPAASVQRPVSLTWTASPDAALTSYDPPDLQHRRDDRLRLPVRQQLPEGARRHRQQPYAVAGIAWDGSTTNRPGARFGPRAIREASHMLCDGMHPHFDVTPLGQLAMRAICRCPTPAWKACARRCRRWSRRADPQAPHGLARRRPLDHAAAAARLPRTGWAGRWR